MLITSLENKKIKEYFKLKNKKNRHLKKMYIVEGSHLVLDAYSKGLLLDILVLENYQIDLDIKIEINYVTKEIMKKLSNLDSIPSLIGVVKMHDEKNVLGDRVLLLDDIQDPGNLGTIIRSALAFNITDIVLGLNTVDLYNDKVIRSTQGMIYSINIIRKDLFQVIKELKSNNYIILGTNVKDGVDVSLVKENKYALIVGNEGNGVKSELQDLCDMNLYIKMNSQCESLNVSVATSILLYELNR